jgi:IS66 C-terminal element
MPLDCNPGEPAKCDPLHKSPTIINPTLKHRSSNSIATDFRRVEAALLPDDVTLIQTAKLNDVDPRAWLGDVLARLPDHPARRIEELLPWQWCGSRRLAA